MTREPLFVDTSAWFAYINAADLDHLRVKQFLDAYPGYLVTSTYVFDETVTLTKARLGHGKAMVVGETLRSPRNVELTHVTPLDERAAWNLFGSRKDKFYSFTDCTSFVIMRKRKIKKALTLDDHFNQEGFEVVPA